jgi:hypothetical protein
MTNWSYQVSSHLFWKDSEKDVLRLDVIGRGYSWVLDHGVQPKIVQNKTVNETAGLIPSTCYERHPIRIKLVRWEHNWVEVLKIAEYAVNYM